MQTIPPLGIENARCGPSAPQRAHWPKDGDQPATASDRQQVGVEDELAVVVLADQGTQSGHEQGELLDRRLALLGREPLGRLEHRRARRPTGVVAGELSAVSGDRLDLGHRVQGSSLVQLDVDVAERLEPGTDATGRLAHPSGHPANATVRSGEEGDDAIGLAQLLGTQHDGLVAVEGHATFSLPER